MSGVTVGVIRDVKLDNERVLVQLEFFKPLRLFSNYSLRATDTVITTADKGILGDRIIHLWPGDSTKTEVPSTDTLHGVYYKGISEVVGQAWRLRELIRSYREIADEFLNGTENEKSFVKKYYAVLESIDSTTLWLVDQTVAMSAGVSGTVDDLGALTDSISEVSRVLNKEVPPALQTTRRVIHTTDSILTAVSPAITTLDSITTALSTSPLFKNDPRIDKMREGVGKLKSIVSFMKNDAANIKLILVR